MQTLTTTEAALTLAYLKAIEAYPTEKTRILKGAKIAAQPFDVLEHDGYTTVNNSDGTRQYTVNGACECKDYKRGTNRCKHRYAVSLHRKMASLHKAMHDPKNWWVAEVGETAGVCHIVDESWVFIPYNTHRGFFTNSSDCTLLTSGVYFAPSLCDDCHQKQEKPGLCSECEQRRWYHYELEQEPVYGG